MPILWRVCLVDWLRMNIRIPFIKVAGMRYRYWFAVGASIPLGLVFITSGVGKLAGRGAFFLSISSAAVMPPVFATIIATLLPWVELLLGVSLIAGVLSRLSALLSSVLAIDLIIYNTLMIISGLGYEPCGCLGIFERLLSDNLSSINALYVDIGILALALVIYFLQEGKLLNIRPWFLGQSKMR